MAVKIRLARAGAKKAPFYRVVAADSRVSARRRSSNPRALNPRTAALDGRFDLVKIVAWSARGSTDRSREKLIAIAKGEKTAPVVDEDLQEGRSQGGRRSRGLPRRPQLRPLPSLRLLLKRPLPRKSLRKKLPPKRLPVRPPPRKPLLPRPKLLQRPSSTWLQPPTLTNSSRFLVTSLVEFPDDVKIEKR